MLINTAVFFIHWKKSRLQSPLVASVKEQATTMKSDSAASSGVDTGGARGSIRCCVPGKDSKRLGNRTPPSLLPQWELPRCFRRRHLRLDSSDSYAVNGHSRDPNVSHPSGSPLLERRGN